MKNNKGFTFVEILAVIVLIGILSSIAIVGVSRYKENAKNKDYEALAKASYNAMEEYMMKNPYKKEVSLETLDNGNFLSNRTDPGTKSTDCSGAVKVSTTKGTNGAMDSDTYTVYLCCTNYKKIYTYPNGNVTDLTDTSMCDFEEVEEEEGEIPPVTPGGTTTVKVTLNGNGATTPGTASVNVAVGDTKLPTITNPRKTVTITYVNKVGATVTGGDKSKNYTLNGWYTATSNGSKVASNATQPALQKSVSGYTDASGKWTKTSNTTLYAHWDPVTATLPTVTKTGHTCKWTTVNDGTTQERASGGSWTFTSANSRTFTAVCTANTATTYKVTLNNNGATTAGTASVNVKVGDTKLPTITNPSKKVTITYVNNVSGATVSGGDKSKNYTLNGWYTAASNGSKVASSATTPVLQKNVSGYTDASGWSKKSDTTLYAHWDPVTATLPKVTKTGYTCKWTTDNGSSERASGGTWTFTSANSRTFSVSCTPNKYTITIKKGSNVSKVYLNGSASTLSKSFNYGTTVTINADASDYYQITGWYSGSSRTYSSTKTTFTVTRNLNLTANSRKNKVILDYYANGGHLTPGGSQVCPIKAGCKKSECDWADKAKTKELDGCLSKTGRVYTVSHVYDSTELSDHGLRNYAKKRNGTIYLTRSGCSATKKYYVGSAGSGTKIEEGTKYSKISKLAKDIGKESDLKKGDVTVKLYAGWNC